VERTRILIVADEAEFVNAVTAHWPAECAASFALSGSDDPYDGDFDLAIAGSLHRSAFSVLEKLRLEGKPVVHVSRQNGETPRLTGIVSLPEAPGWPDLLAVVAGQILERERAASELSKQAEINSKLERDAVLGRYIVDMRHNLNNALTAVLGNCDLILLDQDQLPSATKGQVETIRNMGMRLNEIMARFTSLQKEMLLVEQQKKALAKSAATGL
jgi:signal transduction histidine kinase